MKLARVRNQKRLNDLLSYKPAKQQELEEMDRYGKFQIQIK